LAVRRLFGRRSVLVRRLARWLVGWLSGGRWLSVGWVLLCGWLGRAAGWARVVCVVRACVACVCLRVSVRVSGRVWLGACGWLWVRPARVCGGSCVVCLVCAFRPRVVVRVRVCVCVCSVSLLPLELPGRARSWRSAKQGRRHRLGWGIWGGVFVG